jgi:hypothetical protein
MKNLAAYRGPVLNPPLESIDDTRNGIVLSVLLHRPFGAGEFAFLQVSYSTYLSSISSI